MSAKASAATYNVRPFSGARYSENCRKCRDSDETPCAICGRAVRAPWPHTAIVVSGGAGWGNEKSDVDDAGYMGAWPVGADCHRRHVVTGKLSVEIADLA